MENQSTFRKNAHSTLDKTINFFDLGETIKHNPFMMMTIIITIMCMAIIGCLGLYYQDAFYKSQDEVRLVQSEKESLQKNIESLQKEIQQMKISKAYADGIRDGKEKAIKEVPRVLYSNIEPSFLANPPKK